MERLVGIQVVGYKRSGKTSLCEEMARLMKRKGKRVAYVKMCHHPLDRADSDTERLSSLCEVVIGVSPSCTGVFYPHPKGFTHILSLMDADVILVEGGKGSIDFLPRIVLVKGEEEEESLFSGPVLGVYSPERPASFSQGASFRDVDEIVNEVLGKGFFLPGADCKGCGLNGCHELAMRIIRGQDSPERCFFLYSTGVEIEINGKRLPINPFVEKIISSTICGLLSPLKGFSRGELRIKMKVE